MKISMYMLQHWFADDNPIVTIVSGERAILGARLFTDNIDDNDHLYVGKMSNFFPQSKSEQVILVFRLDMICLATSELDEVFNRVLEAFDFYNNLEVSMMQGIYQEAPEQYLISIWEELLGPTFIMTPDYQILACSQNYHNQSINKYWDFFSVYRYPSIDDIISMRSSNIASLMAHRQYITEFVEHNAYPYDYGIISSYYDLAGSLIGHFIIASDKPVTSFEKDAMEIILEALSKIRQKVFQPPSKLSNMGDEILFISLLEGKKNNEENVLRAIKNWQNTDYFQIFTIDQKDLVNQGEMEIAKNELKKYFGKNGIIVIHNSKVCGLLHQSNDDVLLMDNIMNLANKMNVRFGISNPFSQLYYCTYYVQQCEEALARSSKHNAVEFREVALQSIICHSDMMYKKLAKHPLATILDEYDQNNNTNLCYTLSLYLSNERSIKKAAQELFVHRNTVQYRLEKIKEMYHVDWESVEERMYLLFSLLIPRL